LIKIIGLIKINGNKRGNRDKNCLPVNILREIITIDPLKMKQRENIVSV